MKKAIVLSVLGVAASGFAAFGQGVIAFNNYQAATYATDQVMWGAGTANNGSPVLDANVSVQLFYQLGTISESPTAFLNDVNTVAGTTGPIQTSITYLGGGYYQLGNQLLSGWSSGSVTFMVAAWDTTTGGGTLAGALSGGTAGLSSLWQEADDSSGTAGYGIRSSANPAEYMANCQGVTLVSTVPEPTTLAFAGMGMLSLLAFARRKKA